MAQFDLKAYARQGAAVRVAELTTELEQLYRAFPELRTAGPMKPGTTRKAVARKRKRRKLSAAQRAAISKRMKRRWAVVKREGGTRLGIKM